MLFLVAGVELDGVAEETQVFEDFEECGEVGNGGVEDYAGIVVLGEAAEAGDYDGAAVDGWEKVLVDDFEEFGQAGGYGVVPSFVALKDY